MRRCGYTPEELRSLWVFVHEDFERFLELLSWLDTLSDADAKIQTDSAVRLIHRAEDAEESR